MEALGSIGGLLTGVLSIAVIVIGGLLALIYGTNRVLRDTADDLRKRVGDLEKTLAEDRAALDAIRTERDVLARVITGEAHWIALGEELAEHRVRAWAFMDDANKMLSEIRDLLQQQKDAR